LGSEESEIKFEKGIHALATRPAKKNADGSMNLVPLNHAGIIPKCNPAQSRGALFLTG